jgi:ATP-dependent RNA helicase DHX57
MEEEGGGRRREEGGGRREEGGGRREEGGRRREEGGGGRREEEGGSKKGHSWRVGNRRLGLRYTNWKRVDREEAPVAM